MVGVVTVAGASLWDLVAESERDETARVFTQLLANPSLRSEFVDRQITRRDGVRVRVQVKSSDLRDDPTVAGLVITLRDVTEKRQLEEQLKHQAFHDTLTGPPNRLLFQDRISEQLAVAGQHGRTGRRAVRRPG